MMEVLQFIFSDFWHWLGAFMLLGTIAAGLGRISLIRIRRDG